MTEQEFGLGALPSPPDPRDWKLPLPMAVSLPARYVVPNMGGVAVLNQGSTPECVAYSSCAHKMWEEIADNHPGQMFNMDWLYQQAQAIDGIPMPHDGTTIRAALQVMKSKGVPPAGSTKPGSPVSAYYSVPFDLTSMKTALKSYGPLLVASTWYQSWFKPVNAILPEPDYSVGGHAILMYGWDDNVGGGSFLLRNSWGRSWSNGYGNCYAPYRFYLPALHDAWKVVDVKGD